jgi:hypothetical protein
MNKKSFGKIGVWHSDGNHADAKPQWATLTNEKHGYNY